MTFEVLQGDDANDVRASHRVTVFRTDARNGAHVQIPYKGYIISLAMDGYDTQIFLGDDNILGMSEIHGTDGEAIKKAIKFVDDYIEAKKPL